MGPCFLSGLTQFVRFGPVGPDCMLVLQHTVISSLSSSETHGGKVLPWHFIISICGSPHPTEDNNSDVSIQDISPAFGCHIFKTLINAVLSNLRSVTLGGNTVSVLFQNLVNCLQKQYWFQLKSCPKR